MEEKDFQNIAQSMYVLANDERTVENTKMNSK